VAEQSKPGGLVITDDGGNYYYLRPEVLAQAKMPDEDVKKLKSGISTATGKSGELSMDDMQAVAGGAGLTATQLAVPNLQHVSSLNFAAVSRTHGPDLSKVMTSTVMCPW
jgi:hypothetical protein